MDFWAGLQVRMLGDFQVAFEDRPVSFSMKQSAKPMQLLQILLESYGEGVSRNNLMEALFSHESEDNGARSLNVAVSRLRKLLRETDLPEGEYINIRADRYFFECPFPAEVDVVEVERLRRAADVAKGADRASRLYELCDLYRGRFLPELDGEDWVEVARAKYQRIFRNSMEELCQMLEDMHAYTEMGRLADFASAMFPFDEWQVWQIKSMLALGRVKDARKLYRDVEKLYAIELDAPPSIAIQGAMQLDSYPWRDTASPDEVAEQMRMSKMEVGQQAYLPFPSFLATCNLLSRNEEALNGTRFVLATMKTLGPRSATRLEEAMEDALEGRGIYSKYSRTQYLMAMFQSTDADVEDVVARLSQSEDVQACPIDI